MAISPAHKLGQIIGHVLEVAIFPALKDFADRHNLYLDKKGPRRPVRKGSKVTWTDLNGNSHDLDFVLERGGTPTEQGIPAAFIETAWRRYPKHSRNKAQEIQGAIIPLVETYQKASPFTGAVLAGVFTGGALTQLDSLGFTVLFYPYELVVKVFAQYGIDVHYEETTPDAVIQERVNAWQSLGVDQRARLAADLIAANSAGTGRFLASLEVAILRQIEVVIILPLHGEAHEMATVDEALAYINGYDENGLTGRLLRYEIQIRYNNGNVIEGRFRDKPSAIEFLRGYQPIPVQ